MVINILMLAQPIYSMQIYDRVMTSRNMTTMAMLTLIAMVIFISNAIVEWARSQVLVRIGVRMDHVLGPRLLELSHRLGIEQSGSDGRRLMGDLTTVRTFLTGHSIFAMLDAPWVPVFFLAVFLMHPSLAMIQLYGALFLVGLTYITEKLTAEPLRIANERGGEAARFAAVNLRNTEVIESMGMLPAMTARWQERQDAHLQAQAKASDRAGLTQAISRFARTVNGVATMAAGSFLVIAGDISMGVMVASGLLSSRILAPIDMIVSSWPHWSNVREAWGRLDQALSMPPPPTTGIALPPPKGEISLEALFGGAPGAELPFVKNVSLKIPAGASVAIIGSSASGKSTLMRMITGVWLPHAGTIRIDGADIRTWPRAELGPHIGYLPQDVELIEGSIAENIARHGEVDSDKVIAAATIAGVHDMILHMPRGYATPVGVGGANLSGGQRQRIGSARAMYGDPPLLILDEPNANLDEAGEMALDAALRTAKERNQTVLIVSHRPIAIRNCDLVMVMQSGQVSLYGPREQVLAVLANAASKASAPPAAPAPPATTGGVGE